MIAWCENERQNVRRKEKKKKTEEGIHGAHEILYTWQNDRYECIYTVEIPTLLKQKIVLFCCCCSVAGIHEMYTQRQW